VSKIGTYPIITAAALNDIVIGTDVSDKNNTKNFQISQMLSLGSVLFQTDGVDNVVQNKVDLISGNNITLTDDGLGGITIDSDIRFETNYIPNTLQSVFNLIQGTNVTLTPDGVGGVVIDATAGVGDLFQVLTAGDDAVGKRINFTTQHISYVQFDENTNIFSLINNVSVGNGIQYHSLEVVDSTSFTEVIYNEQNGAGVYPQQGRLNSDTSNYMLLSDTRNGYLSFTRIDCQNISNPQNSFIQSYNDLSNSISGSLQLSTEQNAKETRATLKIDDTANQNISQIDIYANNNGTAGSSYIEVKSLTGSLGLNQTLSLISQPGANYIYSIFSDIANGTKSTQINPINNSRAFNTAITLDFPEVTGVLATTNEIIRDANVDLSVGNYPCASYGVYRIIIGSNTRVFDMSGFLGGGTDGDFVTLLVQDTPVTIFSGVTIFGNNVINNLGLYKIMKYGNELYINNV
jgi:hypothetical protein